MAVNTGVLAGRTLFITGASRGIGKAIALKAARDGANVVIAAKTAEPHPKLPGTIYTAAEEVEAAGGKCLPCVVDIRLEDQVEKAVDMAVQRFGGIDILVNNASAISLTGTLKTNMKKFDLMMGINGRGTYLCSRVCLPHLLKATNPHILNISPPLNLNPIWFKGHNAYTQAKYGMSMCALGMAEEFKEEGVAVNCLWPRTAILTAAMEMLGGGAGIASRCRKPEIMADAAYVVLTTDSRAQTGGFLIDDDVLQKAGVTDMDQYQCVPGESLLPDFFLDECSPEDLKAQVDDVTASSAESETSGEVGKMFAGIQQILTEDLAKSVGGSILFQLSGAEPGDWHLDLSVPPGSAGQGPPPSGDPRCTMSLKSEDMLLLFAGKLQPTMAFMSGKLKIKGDMALAMKLENVMKKMPRPKL